MSQRQHRVSASLGAALAVLVLVLSGCAASHTGSLVGQARLYGNVPGHGNPLILGVARDGKVMATASIRSNGGRFDLSAPPGRYQVGLWLPGSRQLLSGYMICVAGATVTVIAGHETAVTVTCEWH
jgi:hypothetical protein